MTQSWKILQFMNINLLRTKRNENWTFWGSPFSITTWRVYLSSGGRTKDLVRKTYFGILSTNLILKFNLPTDLFFASRKNISCTPCTPIISFLSALNSLMCEFKIHPSNLSRYEKDTNNRTNFTYVGVNLIFQRSTSIRKTSNRA